MSAPLILASCLLIAIGYMIYSNTFQAPFHFDGNAAIVENTYIMDISNIKRIHQFYPSRVIAFMSFALNYHFHHQSVFGYHLINWLIHIFNAFLVWILMTLTIKLDNRDVKKEVSTIAGYVGALIFLVHPLQTQIVTYIYQRITSMAILFSLLALIFYVQGRMLTTEPGEKGRAVKFFGCSVLCIVLAMFCKELAITLPLLIAAYEIFFFRRQTQIGGKSTVTKRFLIAALLLILVIPATYKFDAMDRLFEPKKSESHTEEMITAGTYTLTQFRIFPLAIRLLFLPINQSVDYDVALSKSVLDLRVLMGFGFLLFYLFMMVRLFKGHRLISFALAWVLISYSYNLVPKRNIFAEQYVSFCLFGFCLFLISAAPLFIRHSKKILTCACALIIVFSLMTFKRNRVWANPISLWSDVVKKFPHKSRGHDALGTAYFKEGQYDKAFEHYKKSIIISQSEAYVYINLGNIYFIKDEYELAIELYNEGLSRSSEYGKAKIYNNLGNVYFKMGRFNLAINNFMKAPNTASAFNNKGVVLKQMKRYDLAIEAFNKAIEINPSYAESYYNRATVYGILNHFDKAKADFEMAIKFKPNYSQAYHNRGVIHSIVNEQSKSLADYNKALDLNPKAKQVYLMRGTLLTLNKDYPSAIQDFSEALKIDPQYSEVYFRRGDVYRLTKQYDLALQDYDKAVGLTADFIDAYLNRGATYYLQSNYDSALKDFNYVIRLNDQFAPAYMNRSRLYNKLERRREALDDAEKAKSLGYTVDQAFLNHLTLMLER